MPERSAPPGDGDDRDVGAERDTPTTSVEERFWRGGGAADTGAAPPEPGTTPAELTADEMDPESAPGGSRPGT